jgi:glycosyltransferase involved in cell wall biosynthesis
MEQQAGRLALRIGLYSPFFGSTVGGGEKYLGVTAEAIRDAFPRHRVEIVSPVPVDLDRYHRMLGIDFDGIQVRSGRLPAAGLGRRLRRLPLVRRYADLALSARAVAWTREYDLLLSMVYVMPAFSLARRGVILCQFPYQLGRERSRWRGLRGLLYRVYLAPYERLRRHLLGPEIDAFQLVICQSEYVRGWVGRYWGRDAEVVNPPVDVPVAEPDFLAKEPIVLSVGRFFASGHSKRHDLMVEAFRRMWDGGLRGWELHLVGSVHRDDPGDLRYFEQVCRRAEGYPIHVHADAPLEALLDLYRRASIYWHAAGYGVDAEHRPIDLEHFGMTTAEAMAHGVVPVAIARGGQVEVVRAGVDGFLWEEPGQLVEHTLSLIADGELRRRMGEAARRASFRFSRDAFKRRMATMLRPLVEELERELGSAAVDER